MQQRATHFIVGLFMLLGLVALVVLAFQVSGLTRWQAHSQFAVTAEFDNIGGLKTRAPVRIAGVSVGEVGQIKLDPHTFRAKVTLMLDTEASKIPVDSSAKILTEGLLGANYISLTPGMEDQFLHAGSEIETTHPALILENMIGQLLFNLRK